jgi:predicted ATPase
VNYSSSIALVEECLIHAQSGEDKARLLWIRSRVYWARNEFPLALEDTLQALAFLDCHINHNPSRSDLDTIFEATRSQIMSIGMENILELPRSASERIDLIASLLVESSNHAYWISDRYHLFEFLGWKV